MASMMYKILCSFVTFQIVIVYGQPEKFFIQNNKTGLILESARFLQTNYWENKDSQLWNVIPSKKPGHYVVINFASRKALTYRSKGIKFQKFKMKASGETLIQVENHTNVYLISGTQFPYFGLKQDDGSDTWLILPEVQDVGDLSVEPE